MAGGAVEVEFVALECEQGVGSQRGGCLDRDRRIGGDRGAEAGFNTRRVAHSGATKHGVADQPIKLDRSTGAIDRPHDQIAEWALRRLNNRLIEKVVAAVGWEYDFPVDRWEEV